MKPGDVADILIGTRLNKTSMVMTGEHPVMDGGGVKPSGGHNRFNAARDSIAMSRGGASAGNVYAVSIRFFLGALLCCSVEKSECSDRHLFQVLKKRQGILMAFQSGRGHVIPGFRKAVLENLGISTLPSMNMRGLLENWITGRN